MNAVESRGMSSASENTTAYIVVMQGSKIASVETVPVVGQQKSGKTSKPVNLLAFPSDEFVKNVSRMEAQELQSIVAREMTSNSGKYTFIRCLRGSDISQFVRTWVGKIAKEKNRFDAISYATSGSIDIHEWMAVMEKCTLCHEYLVYRARPRVGLQEAPPGSFSARYHPIIRVYGKCSRSVNLLIKNNHIEDIGTDVYGTFDNDASILYFPEKYNLSDVA